MANDITLAMIVKDDAVRLRRCLESVRTHVHHMVIVDTGSSDDTVEVARSFGADVIQIEWPGAFDAAINVALDAVDSPWTLRLDSDEWFEAEDAARLSALASQEQVFAYYFVRRDFYDDIAPTEISLLRMWRTDPRMRYAGIVHENIPQQAAEEAAVGREVRLEPITILHDGYRGGTLSQKRRRNIELLERQLGFDPDNLYARLALIEAKVAENDPAGITEATEMADRFLREDQPQEMAMAGWVLGIALESVPDDQLFSERTDKIIREILRGYHRNPTPMWAVARTEMRRSNGFHAYQVLLELREMGDTGDYDRRAGTPQVFVKDGAWHHLGIVAEAIGKPDVAQDSFRRLLEVDPNHPFARERLSANT